MSLEAAIPTIASLMASLTGLAIADNVAPASFTSNTAKAKLEYRVTSCVDVGSFERVYTYDVDADTLIETIEGTKRFTLTVECEGFTSSPTKNALHYLEKISNRLAFQSSIDTLNAAGLTLVEALSYVDLPRSHDDRTFSRGAKDFIFLGSYSEAHDDTDNAGESYIAEVDLMSHYLYDPAGVVAVNQIDLQVIAP